MTPLYPAVTLNSTEITAQTVSAEGGKMIFNNALKTAQFKPSSSLATSIICLAAPGGPSISIDVACKVLISKTFG